MLIVLLISFESLVVVEAFFQHGKSEHEDQRGYVCDEKAHFKPIEELSNAEQQEVEIVKEAELIIENEWYKRHEVVFLVVDLV